MSFPIKVCVVCGEEFELRPGKPGFANRCPSCSTEESTGSAQQQLVASRREQSEVDAARRRAIRDLLYSKDS
ncbi:MAG: hypothetical protein WCE75_01395 [Terracidiphilus sp.]